MRISLGRSGDQVLDEALARIFARARAGLQNNRRADFVSSGHDSVHLLQVVDVKRRNAVAIGCGVVKQFAHGNKCHWITPWLIEMMKRPKYQHPCHMQSRDMPCGCASEPLP